MSSDPDSTYALVPANERTEHLSSDEGKHAPLDQSASAIPRKSIKYDYFGTFVTVVIAANIVAIGLETDHPESHQLWTWLERSFLVIYGTEIVVRYLYLGNDMFTGADLAWNVFDLLVIVVGTIEMLAEIFWTGHQSSIAAILPIFRLLRVLRVFRLFRVIKQLHTLAIGFLESLVAVFWVTVLCSMLLFVCAVLLVRNLGQPLGIEDDVGEVESADFYAESFGTVPRSMLTLFMLMGTPDLTRVSIAMNQYLWVMVFFILYIIFGCFATISVLTGVISESMVAKGQLQRESQRFEEEELQRTLRHKLRNHFASFDTSGDGLLTKDEFIESIPAILQFLEKEGDDNVTYTETDLIMVFDLMDRDGTGTIDVDEFLMGMEQFDARLHQMPVRLMKFRATVNKQYHTLDDQMNNLSDELEQIKFLLTSKGDHRPRAAA